MKLKSIHVDKERASAYFPSLTINDTVGTVNNKGVMVLFGGKRSIIVGIVKDIETGDIYLKHTNKGVVLTDTPQKKRRFATIPRGFSRIIRDELKLPKKRCIVLIEDPIEHEGVKLFKLSY